MLKKATFIYVLIIYFFYPVFTNAQKYNFTHYDIENGLPESQVFKVCPDNKHRLWIATWGGACRFDGKDFIYITTSSGLSNNYVHSIFEDNKGVVWFGTQGGISYLKNQKVYNLIIPPSITKGAIVSEFKQDKSGTIWGLIDNELFKIHDYKVSIVDIKDVGRNTVTSLSEDRAGVLYVTILNKGVYKFNENEWHKYIPFNNDLYSISIKKLVFDRFDKHKIYFLSNKHIYVTQDSVIKIYNSKHINNLGELRALDQDSHGNLWIGSNTGAYCVNRNKSDFGLPSLINNHILTIYNDFDDNLWIGTNGNGLFKFENEEYFTQQTNDVNVIFSITQNKQGDIFSADSSRLLKYDMNGYNYRWVPVSTPKPLKPVILHTDKDNNCWIGTNRQGIWKYSGGKFEKISGSDRILLMHDIAEDSAGTIWVSAINGCFYYQNKKLALVPGSYFSRSLSVVDIGKDSILFATNNGIRLVINKKIDYSFKLAPLTSINIISLRKFDNLILIGTQDKGVFIWNKSSNVIKNYSVTDGLNSNTVYSFTKDNHNVFWIGTGRGVNKLVIDAENMQGKILPSSQLKSQIEECNPNAILYSAKKVFVGTAKGLIVYNSDFEPFKPSLPYIELKSAKIISPDSGKDKNVHDGDKISFKQNHLALSFLGIYLKDPDAVLYRYRMIGLDEKFSSPIKNNRVDYPSIPPGEYIFEVEAIAPGGYISKNSAKLSFEIISPFYQTVLFKVIFVLLFIILIISLQSAWYYYKKKRHLAIETIKLEEKQKILQQTAEDFHDELGNKLTRISILSELLATEDDNKEEQKNIISQIKQNVALLYAGSRDILWALDPTTDNLYDIMCHIKDFGTEIFNNTPIGFQLNGLDERFNQIKLPMDASRNIPTIFKELFNNALKYSMASSIVMEVFLITKNELKITLTDNGQGFDQQKASKGRGLNNITKRANRIGAGLNIFSKCGIGTTVILNIKLNS